VLIYLVQPDDAIARELQASCEESGYHARRVNDADPDAVRALGDDRPDAVLVSLDGDADTTLDLVVELAQRRRLRGVPLVFCGGTQDALNRAQDRYPRASFARRDVLMNVLASLRS
jgi:DNA-binding response OmpR family regulator